MWRLLPLLSGAAVVVATGVVDGLWNNRWRPDSRLEKAVARLKHVPRSFGGANGKDWEGTDEEVSRADLQAARIDDYICRRYVNERNRQAVLVLLVCGRPGPISVHTPDVCYTAAGYRMVGSPTSLSVPAANRGAKAEDDFHAARLRSPVPAQPGMLRVCWAWSAGRGWQIPTNPRLTFARSGALYKLYVLREEREAEKGRPEEEGPTMPFLQAFLPELDKALRPDS
jgi:hypothetical protein